MKITELVNLSKSWNYESKEFYHYIVRECIKELEKVPDDEIIKGLILSKDSSDEILEESILNGREENILSEFVERVDSITFCRKLNSDTSFEIEFNNLKTAGSVFKTIESLAFPSSIYSVTLTLDSECWIQIRFSDSYSSKEEEINNIFKTIFGDDLIKIYYDGIWNLGFKCDFC